MRSGIYQLSMNTNHTLLSILRHMVKGFVTLELLKDSKTAQSTYIFSCAPFVQNVIHYADDLMIATDTSFRDHLSILEKVLQRLGKGMSSL